MKSAMVQARIEPKLKIQADKVIKKLGLNTSQVINALYTQIALTHGIPFELRVPNKETLAAMNELEQGKPKTYDSVEAMFDDFE